MIAILLVVIGGLASALAITLRRLHSATVVKTVTVTSLASPNGNGTSQSLTIYAKRETTATIAELRVLTDQLDTLAQTLAKKVEKESAT